ncbi:hypothetical protein [Parasphingorhabdus sp.]|uniref:hypothetical protein n=1 Tax=Parasphingorhabdus sp. TaxID=2709688 RepID=UPI0032983CC7
MTCAQPAGIAVVAFFLSGFTQPMAEQDQIATSSWFEGRWAFAEEDCDQPSNWTMIAGGNFVSEDLTGTWEWADGELTLSLTDLATDEETGEAGGRFQMVGPTATNGPDEFTLTIEPDIYVMKRCP